MPSAISRAVWGADSPVLLQRLVGDGEQILLGLVGVGDHPHVEHLRGAGHIGQPLGQQAAGAAFGGGQSLALGFQQGHHQFFQGFGVHAVDKIPHPALDFLNEGAGTGCRPPPRCGPWR